MMVITLYSGTSIISAAHNTKKKSNKLQHIMESNDEYMQKFGESLINAELLSASVVWNNDTITQNEWNEYKELLVRTSKILFDRIEELGSIYSSKIRRSDDNGNSLILSGLDELYTGIDNNPGGLSSTSHVVDVETLWGQVDLQNDALHSLLKNSVKKLVKAATATEVPSTTKNVKSAAGEIRLLDTNSTSDEEESDADDETKSITGDDNDSNNDGSNDDLSNEDDEPEVDKMHARMNRIMADMDDDDEDDEQQDSPIVDDDDDSNDDPAAEELNDGFFSVKEMEGFADEEEEYLPDDAYGPIEPEKKEKDNRTFHQKQRDGDLDSSSDSDSGPDDDDSDDAEETFDTVRRKKYRKDEEIEALFQLYTEPIYDKKSNDELDVTQMTAADIYGDPNRKRLDEWKKRNDKKNTFDDKSSSDHLKKGSGAALRKTKAKDSDKAKVIHDESILNKEDSDEDIPMKGDDKEKKQQKKQPLHLVKIEKQTEELEKEMLAEKPWQMLGETGSSSRPVNSLLESTPEFEFAAKMAPLITVEHTADLEEIIKKRILAEDWDDVIPRELPDIGWAKKKGEVPEVSQEKSKLGLGELYEKEYLKKALNFDVDKAEKETEDEKAKNEMKALFANLCSKLDALSNYHFTPRPIADEAEIRPITQPAVAMEEVLPLYVSNARGVAPEEVYAAKRGRDGILRAESELDQQDRKRLRRSKKATRRKTRKDKQADEKLISRLTPGLGLNNPYEKRKAQQDLSVARAGGKIITGKQDQNGLDYNTSGTFFKRMQAEAEQSIKDRIGESNGADKNLGRVSSKSSSFKL